MFSKGTVLAIESLVFWIDEAIVARLKQPATHGSEEPKPRQPLEDLAVPCTDEVVHHFVGMIDTDTELPELDSDFAGYESSGSHSADAEVLVVDTAEGNRAAASDPLQPTASKTERARHEELMRTPIPGDTPALRALEAQRQALLTERAWLSKQQGAREESAHDQEESSRHYRRASSPSRRWEHGLNNQTSGGTVPLPVFHTPVQNLATVATLVRALPCPADDDLAVAHYHQILALMKAAVEEQDVTMSKERLASEFARCHPSATTVSSSRATPSTARRGGEHRRPEEHPNISPRSWEGTPPRRDNHPRRRASQARLRDDRATDARNTLA